MEDENLQSGCTDCNSSDGKELECGIPCYEPEKVLQVGKGMATGSRQGKEMTAITLHIEADEGSSSQS